MVGASEQRLHAADVLLGRVLEVDVDEHAAAHLVGRAGRRLDHRDEDAEHEHGDEHRGHGGEGWIAFREIERNASLTKKAGFMVVDYIAREDVVKVGRVGLALVRARRGSGAGSRSRAPNSAVLMSVGAS